MGGGGGREGEKYSLFYYTYFRETGSSHGARASQTTEKKTIYIRRERHLRSQLSRDLMRYRNRTDLQQRATTLYSETGESPECPRVAWLETLDQFFSGWKRTILDGSTTNLVCRYIAYIHVVDWLVFFAKEIAVNRNIHLGISIRVTLVLYHYNSPCLFASV